MSFFVVVICVFSLLIAVGTVDVTLQENLHGRKSYFPQTVVPERPLAKCPMVSGNLLITQPNEFETGHYLAQFTPEGSLVCYYDFGKVLHDGPVDLAYRTTSDGKQELLVLFFLDDLYVVNSTGDLVRKWGNGGPPKGESLFAIDTDAQGNVYVMDFGTNSHRNPRIIYWDASGTYKGLLIQATTQHPPVGMKCVEDGIVLSYGYPGPTVEKFGYDGKHLSTFTPDPKHAPQFFGGVAAIGDYVYVAAEGLTTNDFVVVLQKSDLKLVEYWTLDQLGACPEGMGVSVDKTKLFILNSDPFSSKMNTTQHVVVMDLKGKVVSQFGGHECTNLLCQTFNGILQIV